MVGDFKVTFFEHNVDSKYLPRMLSRYIFVW